MASPTKGQQAGCLIEVTSTAQIWHGQLQHALLNESSRWMWTSR